MLEHGLAVGAHQVDARAYGAHPLAVLLVDGDGGDLDAAQLVELCHGEGLVGGKGVGRVKHHQAYGAAIHDIAGAVGHEGVVVGPVGEALAVLVGQGREHAVVAIAVGHVVVVVFPEHEGLVVAAVGAHLDVGALGHGQARALEVVHVGQVGDVVDFPVAGGNVGAVDLGGGQDLDGGGGRHAGAHHPQVAHVVKLQAGPAGHPAGHGRGRGEGVFHHVVDDLVDQAQAGCGPVGVGLVARGDDGAIDVALGSALRVVAFPGAAVVDAHLGVGVVVGRRELVERDIVGRAGEVELAVGRVVGHPEGYARDLDGIGLVVGRGVGAAAQALCRGVPHCAVALRVAAVQGLAAARLHAVEALRVEGVVVATGGVGREEVGNEAAGRALHVGSRGAYGRVDGEEERAVAVLAEAHPVERAGFFQEEAVGVDGDVFALGYIGGLEVGGGHGVVAQRSVVEVGIEVDKQELAHLGNGMHGALPHGRLGNREVVVVELQPPVEGGDIHLAWGKGDVGDRLRRHGQHDVFHGGQVEHRAVALNDVDVGVVVGDHKVVLVVVVVDAGDEHVVEVGGLVVVGDDLGGLVKAVEAVAHQEVDLVAGVDHVLGRVDGIAWMYHPLAGAKLCLHAQRQHEEQ